MAYKQKVHYHLEKVHNDLRKKYGWSPRLSICGRDLSHLTWTAYREQVTCITCLRMLNSQQEFEERPLT